MANQKVATKKPTKKSMVKKEKNPPGYDEGCRIVFSVDRPYRIEALLDVFTGWGFTNHKAYWKLIGDVWADTEGCGKAYDVWIALWNSQRPNRELAMEVEDQKTLAKLPETFMLYRGYGGSKGKGLSWTTEREKAVWFANRFAMLHHDPRLIEGECSKADVAAFLNRRNESEIIIDPDKVRKQKRIKLDDPYAKEKRPAAESKVDEKRVAEMAAYTLKMSALAKKKTKWTEEEWKFAKGYGHPNVISLRKKYESTLKK